MKGSYNMKNLFLLYLAFALVVAAMPFVADATIDRSAELTLAVQFSNGNTEEISIEDYVLRALAAKEDEVTSLEAKKAFAVSVRSIGMYFATFGCKHTDFDCCDSGECCVALAPSDKASEGTQNAVRETKGQYFEIDGAPAMALFTLCASSGTVQSDEFDYLTPIASGNRCEIHKVEKSFTAKEVLALFPEAEKDLKFYAVYGENNKLSFAIVNNKQIDGEVLATAFKLKSVEMTIQTLEDGICVASHGSGHGMGLDLCNAEKLARDGMYYQKILEIYFPKLNLKGY